MSVLTMATEKKRPTEKPAEEAVTSTRLYLSDSQKLAKVKALRGDDSVAETFRILFGRLLDATLIKETQRTLDQTRQGE